MAVRNRPIKDSSVLRNDLLNYLKEIFVEVFGIPDSRINTGVSLESYGINSLLINQLHAKLCLSFPELSKTTFFQCKTIEDFADFLLLNYSEATLNLFNHTEIDEDVYVEKKQTKENDKFDSSYVGQKEDIAIIGLSGRYPMSETLEKFWNNLQEGKDCISLIPKERWNYEDFKSNEDLTQGHQYCKWGGFLRGIEEFDPLFFNIPPVEAEKMDPQERLFLETAWQVLEDAGYSSTSLNTDKSSTIANKIGVFVGVMWSEYPYFAVGKEPITPFPHTAYWSIANRVSYCLNLHGPSIAIDTACSSSLTALHMACESIYSGSSNMAIAGGVNLSMHPNKYLGLCQMGFTSSEGKCRSFGEGGDGYVPAEGVGAVLLKPLKDALQDRDHIYGVIKGSAINHGGKTNGYTVPDPQAHANLIIEAIKRSSINPRQISYVEAHGTGTPLGDPIEIRGLTDAFNYFVKDKGFCAIGSVKSNMGHAEASAGIAGLTKILLQFKHHKLVPTLHSENINKDINFAQTPFYLQKNLTDWKRTENPRYAGISSFGAGGSNAHVILADAPEIHVPCETKKPYYLIVLSAKTDKAFTQIIKNMIIWLNSKTNEHYSIESISYTLNTGREHFIYRGAWVAENKSQLIEQLISSLETKDSSKQPIDIVSEDKLTEELIYNKTMKIVEEEIKQNLSDPQKYKETLTLLSKLYVKGFVPNWDILHRGELCSKISLPTYPFTRESYWVTERKVNDGLFNRPMQRERTRKPLFYQKSWIECPLFGTVSTGIKSIIIYDQKTENFAKNILKYYDGSLCIDVSQSHTYLDKDLSKYSGWVDLSSNYLSSPQECLLQLLQRWIESNRFNKITAIQITTGLESLNNNKISLLGAEKVGLYRMLGYEYSYLTSFHIDLDPTVTDLDILTNIVIKEVNSAITQTDVCCRNNLRYVAVFQEVEFDPTYAQSIQFDQSRVLLITGGTRGIGFLLAKHFIHNYGVKKLVLLGKEQFPPKEQWANKSLYSNQIAEKIENIQQLEKLGIEIKVIAPPLENSEIVKKEINSIITSMGPIAGVIHAAGSVDNENPAFIRKPIKNIESLLLPKIDGLKNLLQAIDHSELKVVILCSSISAMIPKFAVGLSDYAAANAFMDYFASANSKNFPIISVQWPSWKDTGMGEVVSESYRESGILSLEDDEGLRFIDQIVANLSHTSIMPLIVEESKFNLSKLLCKNPIEPVVSEDVVIKGQITDSSLISLQHSLQRLVEEELKLKKESLDCSAPFANYGIDSILLTQIVRKINKTFKIELNLAHLLEHNTVAKITNWLLENEAEVVNKYSQTNANQDSSLLSETKKVDNCYVEALSLNPHNEKTLVKNNVYDSSLIRNQPIAVIGMSCQFAGADSLEKYWNLLANGKSAISAVPENCWGIKTEYFAGLLDRVYEFDPDFFMIAKEDVFAMDPQATLLMKESLNAIYDANYTVDEVSGSATGVYIGARSQHQIPEKILKYTRNPIMAFGQNYLSANISHFFNFYGPSIVVDTACSSALVAMNMAVEALQLGKIQQALVAGVNLLTTPSTHRVFEQRKLLQKEGIFHIFDERASGIVLGEGVGAVYLKPLSNAQKDGDKIYAVISSISINNDGRTAGPAAPNIEAQQKVMKSAIAVSDCSIEDIKYLDVNGSGSRVTDLLELKSIDAVYRKDFSNPFYLGSMKPNIGHPLCAEGIASFIKVCLMLYHQTLVPFLSGQQPLKHFSLEEKNMILPLAAQLISLPYAAINCFADGGTNAHVILKQHKADMDNKRKLSSKSIPTNLIDTRTLCPKIFQTER